MNVTVRCSCHVGVINFLFITACSFNKYSILTFLRQRAVWKSHGRTNTSAQWHQERCLASWPSFTTARGRPPSRQLPIAGSGRSSDSASKLSWWGLGWYGKRSIQIFWKGKKPSKSLSKSLYALRLFMQYSNPFNIKQTD